MLAAVSVNSPGDSPGGVSTRRSRARHPESRRPRARRALLALTLAVAAAVAMSGCSRFDAALGQQEEVVIFQPGVSNAVKLKVRAACSHVPNVKVEPLPTDHKLVDEIYNVRYEAGSASTTQLAEFTQCLSRFPPSVIQGVETNTPGGDD
jgi:hypothetical protein